MVTKKIADVLYKARLAVENTLADAEIGACVAIYGYTSEKLAEGVALLDAAQMAGSNQLAAAGAQQQATQEFNCAWAAAHDAYQALAKVARAVLDRSSLAGLGLDGREPRDAAGFATAAFILFDNAASVPALAEFGYDAGRLAAGRALIAKLQAANECQEAAKGAAQQSTREQEAALATLAKWTAQYLKIARVALRAEPQMLEKLGVVVKTRRAMAKSARKGGQAT